MNINEIEDINQLMIFIEYNADVIDWDDVIEHSKFLKFPYSFIYKWSAEFNWFNLSCSYLDMNFIREFKDRVNWPAICETQQLSEDFMIEFEDRLSWFHVSTEQEISESFIDKYADKLDWLQIFLRVHSKYSHLRLSFSDEFNKRHEQRFKFVEYELELETIDEYIDELEFPF